MARGLDFNQSNSSHIHAAKIFKPRMDTDEHRREKNFSQANEPHLSVKDFEMVEQVPWPSLNPCPSVI